MTLLAVLTGAVLGLVLSGVLTAAKLAGRPMPRTWATVVTGLLRSLALGVPAGAALTGIAAQSPLAAVGIALASVAASYGVFHVVASAVQRGGGVTGRTVARVAAQATCALGAAGVGVLLGSALVA